MNLFYTALGSTAIIAFSIWLASRCKHDWLVIGRGDLRTPDGRFIGSYYHLRCKHCGKLKEKQL